MLSSICVTTFIKSTPYPQLCDYTTSIIIRPYISKHRMAGGHLQLVGYGPQDTVLTYNPQITFFKTVYRRHTNHVTETVPQSFTNVNFGQKSEITLDQRGDLLTKMYLKVLVSSVNLSPTQKFAWVRRLGYALLDYIEIEIGGVCVDRHYGIWLDIWHELARSGDHDRGFDKMIGDTSRLTDYNNNDKPETVIYIPLKFWFNRHTGLAFPMIALQYHDIKVKLRFNQLKDLIVANRSFVKDLVNKHITILDATLLTDYVYLSPDERRLFASSKHEYLIEQVQYNGEVVTDEDTDEQTIRAVLNYPTKELQWVMINNEFVNSRPFLGYTNEDDWDNVLVDSSKQLLLDSMFISDDEDDVYTLINPQSTCIINQIKIVNRSDLFVHFNYDSLVYQNTLLLSKISATITVLSECDVRITDLNSKLTIANMSTPTDLMTDTRFRSDDVLINQFSNYGENLDGSSNPVKSAKIVFNDYDRVERKPGYFFNYLQPEMHHSNTPKDGINIYSLGFHPEKHQPSGSANLSVVDKLFLIIWLRQEKISMRKRAKMRINTRTPSYQIHLFGFNYNIFRAMCGLTGVAY